MSLNQIFATIFLGVVASLIFFFVQKGFLDSYFFQDDAKNAVEQAKIDAFKAEALRQQEAAASKCQLACSVVDIGGQRQFEGRQPAGRMTEVLACVSLRSSAYSACSGTE